MTSVVLAACVPPETRMFSQTTTQASTSQSTSTSVEAISSFATSSPDAGVAATPLAETSRQRWQHALPPDDRARTTTADVGVTVALLSDKDGSVARAFGSPKAFSRSIRPVMRTTFVIGTDRLILDVINSETHMHIHADRALSHA
jgi:hypothetical protein